MAECNDEKYIVCCVNSSVTARADKVFSILRKGKKDFACTTSLKRGDLLDLNRLNSSPGKDCNIPYSQLGFFWRYLKKFPQNQVRPRKHKRPKVRFVKTRYSRVYMNISRSTLKRHILWFKENIDRGLYNVSALHILHRLEHIASTPWDEVRSIKAL